MQFTLWEEVTTWAGRRAISPAVGIILWESQQAEGKMRLSRHINFTRSQTPPDCGKMYQNAPLVLKNSYAKTGLFYAGVMQSVYATFHT